ncbi:hypothetical protein [Oribacterium sp. P6A1]|uniref:hypothetical protein n=1 Tax=Oribacterium sp. P6A1 TaxID=1410612 RepID=UPI0012DDED7A|nr:hypothetical protein [Oribacterium sp. P6A1]
MNKKEDILNSLVNITHLRTCREEYRLAHDDAVLSNMVSKDNYPDIPIILVTHSSKESQAAYKALGCVHAEEIIPWIADEEPFDVQLEFVL